MKASIKKAIVALKLPSLVSRIGPDRVAILRYHSIRASDDEVSKIIGKGLIHPTAVFSKHMELIASQFTPMTLDEVYECITENRRFPPRAVTVTFDDGFRDNWENARPILSRYGIPATFYVTVGLIGSTMSPWFCRLRHAFDTTRQRFWRSPKDGRVWDLSSHTSRNEARRDAGRLSATMTGDKLEKTISSIEQDLAIDGFPQDQPLMMDWEQVKDLNSSGHIVGAHTMVHPNLAYLAPEDARKEMKESSYVIKEQLGSTVNHFSYPSPILKPHFSDQTIAISRSLGFRTAVTCSRGAASRRSDRLALPRIAVPMSRDEFRWAIECALAGYPRT